VRGLLSQGDEVGGADVASAHAPAPTPASEFTPAPAAAPHAPRACHLGEEGPVLVVFVMMLVVMVVVFVVFVRHFLLHPGLSPSQIRCFNVV
jgi:hypothetical protein